MNETVSLAITIAAYATAAHMLSGILVEAWDRYWRWEDERKWQEKLDKLSATPAQPVTEVVEVVTLEKNLG